jgi:hypothetical protein
MASPRLSPGAPEMIPVLRVGQELLEAEEEEGSAVHGIGVGVEEGLPTGEKVSSDRRLRVEQGDEEIAGHGSLPLDLRLNPMSRRSHREKAQTAATRHRTGMATTTAPSARRGRSAHRKDRPRAEDGPDMGRWLSASPAGG